MNNSPHLNYEYNLTSKQILEKVVKITCLNWTSKNGGKIQNHISNKYWPIDMINVESELSGVGDTTLYPSLI